MPQQDVHPAMFPFWVFGDLHYRAVVAWHKYHTLRLTSMFDDLQTLWRLGERPVFCASPGDLVETCARENYDLAKTSLNSQLADMPFYPGVGNHEYQTGSAGGAWGSLEPFHAVWQRPLRYSWEEGGYFFIMLDYPDPRTLPDADHEIAISLETLSFLDATLAEHKNQPVIIFLHCPLRNTVLDRDPVRHRDFSSQQSFFSPENSDEVRAILEQRGNARLFISGHTHSGWEAPNLVVTEELGGQPVTFVNVMSPWYTGRNTGPHLSSDLRTFEYQPDTPNVVPSFSFRLDADHASIRVREHTGQVWLKEWNVPL